METVTCNYCDRSAEAEDQEDALAALGDDHFEREHPGLVPSVTWADKDGDHLPAGAPLEP